MFGACLQIFSPSRQRALNRCRDLNCVITLWPQLSANNRSVALAASQKCIRYYFFFTVVSYIWFCRTTFTEKYACKKIWILTVILAAERNVSRSSTKTYLQSVIRSTAVTMVTDLGMCCHLLVNVRHQYFLLLQSVTQCVADCNCAEVGH